MTVTRHPLSPVTCLMAAKTASVGGEAKTSPTTAAASIPSPTYPANDGSCPAPPPVISISCFMLRSQKSFSRMDYQYLAKNLLEAYRWLMWLKSVFPWRDAGLVCLFGWTLSCVKMISVQFIVERKFCMLNVNYLMTAWNAKSCSLALCVSATEWGYVEDLYQIVQ